MRNKLIFLALVFLTAITTGAAFKGQKWRSLGDRFVYVRARISEREFTDVDSMIQAASELEAELLSGKFDLRLPNRTVRTILNSYRCDEYDRFASAITRRKINRQLKRGRLEVGEEKLFFYMKNGEKLYTYKTDVLLPCLLKKKKPPVVAPKPPVKKPKPPVVKPGPDDKKCKKNEEKKKCKAKGGGDTPNQPDNF